MTVVQAVSGSFVALLPQGQGGIEGKDLATHQLLLMRQAMTVSRVGTAVEIQGPEVFAVRDPYPDASVFCVDSLLKALENINATGNIPRLDATLLFDECKPRVLANRWRVGAVCHVYTFAIRLRRVVANRLGLTVSLVATC